MSTRVANTSGVKVRRWTREEYGRLAEVGVLHEDDPVELIEGEIVEMAPQGLPHATGIRLAEEAARGLFGAGFDVRPQLPLALGPLSEPEPDLAVVPGGPRDYVTSHPTTALLVVEIADTSLAYDRDTKGSLYARAGILDYWIVNLARRRLEIYRDPGPMPDAPFGFGYRSRRIALPDEVVGPLARPEASLTVSSLLP
ncbi:MAG: Uma2 family endonuclease [Chloroflexi bacterium]|nr:Uma2 family endonuclease [Chloroflexota bacterium]